MKRRHLLAVLGGAALAAAALTAGALAGDNDSGFKTAQPSMVAPVMSGVDVTPIITVGDTLPSGYRFEAIPDGIAVKIPGQITREPFGDSRRAGG